EISNLTKIIQPNFVLITGVAAVHIAHFGNIEAIAKAKCEIPEGLINDGVVVLNADDKLLQDTYKEIWGEKFKVKTFGKSDLSDVKVLKTKPLGLSGIEVEILLAGEKVELKLSTPGEHNAINAAAALCSVLLFYPQADIAELANALKRFVPPLMRLNILPLKGGRQLVDDSYNANPYSMKALLKIAQQEMQLGKKVCLILGDMLELGREAKDRHSELAKQVSELKPEYFIAVGEYADLMSQIVKESGVKSFVAESPESAAHTALKINVDLIMIKASRGVGLDRASKIILDKEGLN
ncbi:MAG: hypothetical protein KDD56_10425, partial [Bdellovibrionales bacterium]|nr:hypothetical protein [Bdellovibrionales bacterium]